MCIRDRHEYQTLMDVVNARGTSGQTAQEITTQIEMCIRDSMWEFETLSMFLTSNPIKDACTYIDAGLDTCLLYTSNPAV